MEGKSTIEKTVRQWFKGSDRSAIVRVTGVSWVTSRDKMPFFSFATTRKRARIFWDCPELLTIWENSQKKVTEIFGLNS